VSAPYSRLLLATEHTEFDAGAERLAFALARGSTASLHVVFPLMFNAEYEVIAPEILEQEEEQAHARIVELRKAAQAAGVAIDVRVRRGVDLAQEIIEEARACGADLVIARRRGKRGLFAKLRVGEMVSKVATHAPCSVLLVPRAGRMWSSRIVAGVDASAKALRAVEFAAGLGVRGRLPLLIVSSVVHDDDAHRATAESAVAAAIEVARRAGADVEGRVLTGRPEAAIGAAAAQANADLIVVGRTGESGRLHRMLLGGTAHRTIGLASGPVLVVGP
jgi:nucleotide-binding universal stress UspA family protein